MLPEALEHNISYKDHVTNEEVRRKIQAAIGEDPGQESDAYMVWPCFKVFWLSKDNPTGHSERKKKKRQTEEEVVRQYKKMDRNEMDFAS